MKLSVRMQNGLFLPTSLWFLPVRMQIRAFLPTSSIPTISTGASTTVTTVYPSRLRRIINHQFLPE